MRYQKWTLVTTTVRSQTVRVIQGNTDIKGSISKSASSGVQLCVGKLEFLALKWAFVNASGTTCTTPSHLLVIWTITH